MFASSREVGRIPVLAILGDSSRGKTDFLNLLLRSPLLANSVVFISGADHAEALEHVRTQYLPALGEVSDSGCLCCGMQSGLGDALRDLFLGVLAKRVPPVDRVIIAQTGSDPAALKFTLRHAPFLGQRYVYRATFLVLDIEDLARRGQDLDKTGIGQADAVVLVGPDSVSSEVRNQAVLAVKQLNPGVIVVLSGQGLEDLLSNTLH